MVTVAVIAGIALMTMMTTLRQLAQWKMTRVMDQTIEAQGPEKARNRKERGTRRQRRNHLPLEDPGWIQCFVDLSDAVTLLVLTLNVSY